MVAYAQELGFPEAPVLLPDGSFLCVEMSPDKGCITHVDARGHHRRLAKTGRPNGLARDRHGSVWVAETAQRAVLRMSLEGELETVATHTRDGEPFLFLNDLAFAPNGDLYVTDSGILIPEVLPNGELNPRFRELNYDGRVYRLDARTGEVEIIDRGFHFTNGIAFGPDSRLYVTETLSGNIYRYEWRNGRVVGQRELFANVIEVFEPAEVKGPDGMKFGADGQLYVAVFGQGDVTVLDERGKVSRRIQTRGVHPTNVCFGPRGSRQLYVTEVDTGSVQVFDVGTDGFPLYD